MSTSTYVLPTHKPPLNKWHRESVTIAQTRQFFARRLHLAAERQSHAQSRRRLEIAAPSLQYKMPYFSIKSRSAERPLRPTYILEITPTCFYSLPPHQLMQVILRLNPHFCMIHLAQIHCYSFDWATSSHEAYTFLAFVVHQNIFTSWTTKPARLLHIIKQ